MNLSLFKTWSPDMAWLLGYIWADGSVRRCIPKSKRSFNYQLNFKCISTDCELLGHVKRILDSHHFIGSMGATLLNVNGKTYCIKPAARLSVSCKPLILDLINLHGVEPNKSGRRLVYRDVPDDFFPHFLRGYFDGDGCVTFHHHICKNKSLSKYPRIIFCGNCSFISKLQSQIIRLTGIHPTKIYLNCITTVNCEWSKRSAVKALTNFMYPTPGLPCLSRKRDLLLTT